jgi:penicillin-binding protein 1A
MTRRKSSSRSKTKARENSDAPKRKTPRRRKSSGSRPLLVRVARFCLIMGIWCFIALSLLVGWYAADLPDVLDSPQFERRASIVMNAADGSQIARYGELTGLSVKVNEMPPHLIYAVIATEDRRFYQHHGVDPIGIFRAMAANVLHRRVMQGGSTITQQLAKNLFLSHERTLKRKIQEALLALWLERRLTKDEILSAYLNRVYLGSGAYGVDAAAHIYFSKSAKDVTLRESAILAGLLKAPSRYAPDSNPGLAAKRAKVVLQAMADAGYITEEEAGKASYTVPTPPRKPSEGGGVRYFTDWVSAELNNMIGTTDRDLVVQTTLDPAIQEAAEKALSAALRDHGAEVNATQGALIVIDRSGAIRAMVGGRDYSASQFNRATQALRPPGSSFKPFVYLTALGFGMRPDDIIEDLPLDSGKYRPQNFHNEYHGRVAAETALALSLNTAAVRLCKEVGVGNVITTARRMGITADLPYDLSLSLGSAGVPMIEMVGAYGTLADGGRKVTPYAVTRIVDKDGKTVYRRSGVIVAGEQVLDPRVVNDMDRMLSAVVEYGTGRRASLPFHAAGKTGTSQDFRDAWFIGYTDRYTAAVWLGNDDNSSMKGTTGGSLPAQVWHDVMLAAHQRGGRDGAYAGSAPESTGSYGGEGGGFGGLIQRLVGFNN